MADVRGKGGVLGLRLLFCGFDVVPKCVHFLQVAVSGGAALCCQRVLDRGKAADDFGIGAGDVSFQSSNRWDVAAAGGAGGAFMGLRVGPCGFCGIQRGFSVARGARGDGFGSAGGHEIGLSLLHGLGHNAHRRLRLCRLGYISVARFAAVINQTPR